MKTTFESVDNLFKFIRESNAYEVVVIYFFTEWCSSCKKMKPVLQQISNSYPRLLLLEIDAEKSPLISNDPLFSISLVPSIFVFKKGVLYKKIEGSITKEVLEEHLQLD